MNIEDFPILSFHSNKYIIIIAKCFTDFIFLKFNFSMKFVFFFNSEKHIFFIEINMFVIDDRLVDRWTLHSTIFFFFYICMQRLTMQLNEAIILICLLICMFFFLLTIKLTCLLTFWLFIIYEYAEFTLAILFSYFVFFE